MPQHDKEKSKAIIKENIKKKMAEAEKHSRYGGNKKTSIEDVNETVKTIQEKKTRKEPLKIKRTGTKTRNVLSSGGKDTKDYQGMLNIDEGLGNAVFNPKDLKVNPKYQKRVNNVLGY